MNKKMAVMALATALCASAQAQTEVQWWHSMTGGLNDWVVGLANDFNASQKDFKVVPTYKGQYAESICQDSVESADRLRFNTRMLYSLACSSTQSMPASTSDNWP